MSDVSASISLCRTSSASGGRGVERRVCLSTITIVASVVATRRPSLKMIVHEGDPADFGKRGEDRVVDVALPVEIRKPDIGGGPARVVLQHALGL
jgi:hypothetical protein